MNDPQDPGPLPETIQDVEMLEELLMSRPTPAAVRAMGQIEGDLLVLGVAGKMGPTVARMTLAAEEMDRADAHRMEPVVRIAGICGRTAQAASEARLIRELGYHAGLVSLAAMRDADDDALLSHCRAVAESGRDDIASTLTGCQSNVPTNLVEESIPSHQRRLACRALASDHFQRSIVHLPHAVARSGKLPGAVQSEP